MIPREYRSPRPGRLRPVHHVDVNRHVDSVHTVPHHLHRAPHNFRRPLLPNHLGRCDLHAARPENAVLRRVDYRAVEPHPRHVVIGDVGVLAEPPRLGPVSVFSADTVDVPEVGVAVDMQIPEPRGPAPLRHPL